MVEQQNDGSNHGQDEEVCVDLTGMDDKRTINFKAYEEVKSADDTTDVTTEMHIL